MQAYLAIYDQVDCFETVVDNICLTKLFWSTLPFIISGSILKQVTTPPYVNTSMIKYGDLKIKPMNCL